MPLLAANPGTPEYSAVIVCVPTVSDEVLKVATPLPFKDTAVPRLLPLSLNCTVPDGVPALAVTVAVNVTDCPKSDGFTDELTVVVVAAVTVAVPVARPKLLSLSTI